MLVLPFLAGDDVSWVATGSGSAAVVRLGAVTVTLAYAVCVVAGLLLASTWRRTPARRD